MQKHAYGDPDVFSMNRFCGRLQFWLNESYTERRSPEKRAPRTLKKVFTCSITQSGLQYYQAHRGEYKRFDEFLPFLLKKYNKDKPALLTLANKRWNACAGACCFSEIL
jgi:hypothetical protein